MDTQEIKKFLDSGAGVALKQFLKKKLNELRFIENIKEIDSPTHQAIEMKAQKRAYLKIREMLKELVTLSDEIKTPDPRDSFDVGLED